jgi:hypothetical protein
VNWAIRIIVLVKSARGATGEAEFSEAKGEQKQERLSMMI